MPSPRKRKLRRSIGRIVKKGKAALDTWAEVTANANYIGLSDADKKSFLEALKGLQGRSHDAKLIASGGLIGRPFTNAEVIELSDACISRSGLVASMGDLLAPARAIGAIDAGNVANGEAMTITVTTAAGGSDDAKTLTFSNAINAPGADEIKFNWGGGNEHLLIVDAINGKQNARLGFGANITNSVAGGGIAEGIKGLTAYASQEANHVDLVSTVAGIAATAGVTLGGADATIYDGANPFSDGGTTKAVANHFLDASTSAATVAASAAKALTATEGVLWSPNGPGTKYISSFEDISKGTAVVATIKPTGWAGGKSISFHVKGDLLDGGAGDDDLTIKPISNAAGNTVGSAIAIADGQTGAFSKTYTVAQSANNDDGFAIYFDTDGDPETWAAKGGFVISWKIADT